MPAPQQLIDAIRRTKEVFVKTDNYVAAVLRGNPDDQTLSTLWDEAQLLGYLYAHAALNHGSDNSFIDGATHINIYVGDALHHSWVHHYRITKVIDDHSWTYKWERIT